MRKTESSTKLMFFNSFPSRSLTSVVLSAYLSVNCKHKYCVTTLVQTVIRFLSINSEAIGEMTRFVADREKRFLHSETEMFTKFLLNFFFVFQQSHVAQGRQSVKNVLIPEILFVEELSGHRKKAT